MGRLRLAPATRAKYRDSWDNDQTAAKVRAVIDQFEDVPPIDDHVRLTLQKWLYRQDRFFGGGGAGTLALVLRVFLDSDVNRGALTEPILCAVSFVSQPRFARHGLALYDALDTIDLTKLAAAVRDTQRDLGPDVFRGSFSETLSIALRRKALQILEPPVAKPVKVKPPAKPPRAETRIPEVQRNIDLGLQLVALRSTIKSNCAFGRQVRRQFEIDAQQCCELMRVARAFGNKPKVYTRLSWHCLVLLSAHKMPLPVRQGLESRIIAGERVVKSDIEAARKAYASRQAGPCRKVGNQPSRQPARPAEKMAA